HVVFALGDSQLGTVRARLLHHGPHAVAVWAGTDGHHRAQERSASRAHLAGAAAGGTGDAARSRGGAVTVAFRAPAVGPERHLSLRPEGGLLQGDVHLSDDVATARLPPTGRAEAERVAESLAEHGAEDVVQAGESTGEQVAEVDRVTLVVAPAPLRVAQDFVRFGDLAELRLGVGIFLVGVGVPLACQPAERLLDLLGTGVAGDPQDLVVVDCHRPKVTGRQDSWGTGSLLDAVFELSGHFLHRRDHPSVVHPHRPDDTDP